MNESAYQPVDNILSKQQLVPKIAIRMHAMDSAGHSQIWAGYHLRHSQVRIVSLTEALVHST